jgi:hypothetical protein
MLDLGIWMSTQAARGMYMKRRDIQALVNAVDDAWDTRLSEKAFKNVYERLQNVLVMSDDDKGGNTKVEENRGKHFRKLEMHDASDESDNEDWF